MLRCSNLDDKLFYYVAAYCKKLENFSFGGSPTVYNMHFSLEGLEAFKEAKLSLKVIRIEYCTKIGDGCVELMGAQFRENLRELHIVRNIYEKTAKISDDAIKHLKFCPNLERLSLVHTRKLREQFHLNVAEFLPNLKYLNIRNCPLQEDLSILAVKCPLLEEVDMSGDSWVKSVSILGIAKHKKIRIYHLGHFEHGDTSCDKDLQEYPPKGLFLESMLKNLSNFPSLSQLYLEQECSLTYWLDVRIKKLRPGLEIRYTITDNIIPKGEALI